jgi:hypothetical protein
VRRFFFAALLHRKQRRKEQKLHLLSEFPLTIRPRNSRCLCIWAVMVVMKHNLPES